MSTAFFNAHIDVLKPFTTEVRRFVKLGDSLTVKPITKVLGYDPKGGTEPPVEHFVVFRVILFFLMAPEDLETDLPVNFGDALHFMEMSVPEAQAEYKSQYAEHINGDFLAACPHLLELMDTKGESVFVPQNWTGINGIGELELTWKGDPGRMKPRPRPVNAKLMAPCIKEINRLLKYHLRDSDSEVASSLVVAPKATSPFIRFCGNYVEINKWIEIDMVNAFHQFKLAELTSKRLSIVTPWGQYRPLFMPEGVGPASGILQATVASIFKDFEDWSIVLFDNFLILADSYEDAYQKLERVLDRCIERNIFLKFSKSWLGVPEVTFFGYVCRHGSYQLSQQRIESVLAIAFPQNTKQLQSFMGTALFFKPFIPHYSTLAAPLNDMGHKDFNWKDKSIHGGRAGHLGVKRTWIMLNKLFPGHSISMETVKDFCLECPVCQKDRHLQSASIPAVAKTLRAAHHRSSLGIDTLKVALDKHGNQYILCLINFYTKLCRLYAVKDKEAITTAQCIFDYICTFGSIDELRSDPGSDFTSEVVAHLLKWLGPTRSFTLVDNPQADGVEGSNKQILRHLKALCMDERVKDRWSDVTVLPIIQLILNEHTSSETGVIPLHATFGDADAIYLQIPSSVPDPQVTHKYVTLLAENLKHIRAISSEYQSQLKAKRVSFPHPESANKYCAGDYVTQMLRKMQLPDKLTPRNKGPFQVIEHKDNWVTCRDLIRGDVKTFHQSDLQVFYASDDTQAFKMAQQDNDQYVVEAVTAHTGDPSKRRSMDFLVVFADGDQKWLKWSPDLVSTVQFEDYCNSKPQLRQLLLTESQAKEKQSKLNRLDITMVSPGQTVYVDIRSWGAVCQAKYF
eukprot:gene22119-28222_t